MRFKTKVSCQWSVVSCLMLLVLGCRSADVSDPVPAELMRSDADSQMEFWHALPEHGAVSNDAAFHAMLLFVDGKDAAENYPERVAELKRRGMIWQRFDGEANEAVQRGTMA